MVNQNLTLVSEVFCCSTPISIAGDMDNLREILIAGCLTAFANLVGAGWGTRPGSAWHRRVSGGLGSPIRNSIRNLLVPTEQIAILSSQPDSVVGLVDASFLNQEGPRLPSARPLSMYRELGNRVGEARVLDSIGGVYSSAESQQALPFFNRALSRSEERRRG